jgi:hypothetical protein
VVIMTNVDFCDVTPCNSRKSRRFGGMYLLHHQGGKSLRSVLQLLVTANIVPSSLVLFNMLMEAIRSSETPILTRATRRHIPDDGILQNYRSLLNLFVVNYH